MLPIDLAYVIQAAINTVQPTAEVKNIQISKRIAPLDKMISGDGDRLQQILWNLLTNAIKFTPTGGQVTVQLSVAGEYAKIEVIDTGIVISPQFLPYAFDRFRQAANFPAFQTAGNNCRAESAATRSNGGFDLGLAIVRNLAANLTGFQNPGDNCRVELHTGTVSASSPGTGISTFTVQLPLIQSVSPPHPPIAQRSEYVVRE